MSCFKPIDALRVKYLKSQPIVFSIQESEGMLPYHSDLYENLTFPCGKCTGCRLGRSRQWAARCMHEASLYDDNCFVTLTYNDFNLPKNNSLNVRDFQLFMKRLRYEFGSSIRFYQCGEYGENFGRPHHHACLFNVDFADKYAVSKKNDNVLYRSDVLEKLWPYGFSTIGNVSVQSAGYVARYVMKKILGKGSREHYESLGIKPEYTTMSRRPGIGKAWFDKFYNDLFPSDFVVVNGVKVKIPKFYDNQYELLYPAEFAIIKERRKEQAEKFYSDDCTQFREIRETILEEKLKKLLRHEDKDVF